MSELMSIGSVLSSMDLFKDTRAEVAEGDYMVDGLLYCGKCKTPKECRIDANVPFFGGAIKACICKCVKNEVAAEDERIRKENAERAINEMRRDGLTDSLYEWYTFERDLGYNPEASKLARKYAENFEKYEAEGTGIMFWGPVGVGKSFFAGCIANALINRGVTVLMTNARTLASEMNKNFGEDRANVIRRIQDVRLLVLDDFGVERDTDYMTEQLYEVINERYKSKRPLIITTNISPVQIRNETGIGRVRIYDRIREMCPMYCVKGESKRRDIAMRNAQIMKDLLDD